MFSFKESIAVMKFCTHSATIAAEFTPEAAAAALCSTVAGTPEIIRRFIAAGQSIL
ncbi:hypothetical protein HanXRQr2_Chr12g0521161 [Helianthus annuus]|uniref:Uncharacterized protein n=1 Tax=Helianthus annuus TaxID=4232 RepID=A0A9K3HED4_HELAN|nr:hypothetical protein HanXRQr2_Chr12g0521161 [Helianthus annuus]